MNRIGRVIPIITNIRKIEWLALIAAIAVMVLLFVKDDKSLDGVEGTELESRLARVLESVDGVGRVKVLINERQGAATAFATSGEREIVGVVIVAEGAKDLRVALALEQAAKTLLNVSLTQVQVLEMQEGG